MTAAPLPHVERLPRTLGIWSAVGVLVGTTIGSGIFRVPNELAAILGSPKAMLLLWVVGGLVTLAGALTIAELAAALPRSGGIFAYILEAFGPFWAFLYGWAELTVIRAAAIGGIASVFASYFGQFVDLGPGQESYVAAAAILVIATLNWVGISYAAVLMNLTTLLKYGALVGLTLLAFTGGTGNPANLGLVAPGSTVTFSLMLTALIKVMWTYDGWSNLSFIGGEVKDPGRNLPRALILGTAAIVAVYLVVNAAYLYLLPVTEMAASTRVAADAAMRIPLLGAAGAAIIAGVVMVSCFGAVNGSIMTGPRIFFALSDRGLFFPVLARVSPRFQTPSVSIWVAAGLGVAYVLQNTFAQLADRFILGTWPFYALAVAAVFVLRKRQPDLPRPYRTWGYPVVPAVFLLGALLMVGNALVSNWADNAVTFGIILTGVPVYWLYRRFMKPGGVAA
jgi:basic amino acid/polyamine antiporter, APA family